jgi:hypothetical protein
LTIEPLLLEFDGARGAPDPFRSQVRVDPFGQPLRSLFIDGEPAVSSLFDHLAFAAGRDTQIRRAEALAVTTAVDREVRPVLATAVATIRLSLYERAQERASLDLGVP